jgi:hypothetical protein
MKNMAIRMGSRSSVLELLYPPGLLNQQMDTIFWVFMGYCSEDYYLLSLEDGGMVVEI